MKEFKAEKKVQESREGQSILNQVFKILNSEGLNRKQMSCQRKGDELSFYTLFVSEQEAEAACKKLSELGQQPRQEGKNVFLTAQFAGEEIDKLAETFTSIPKSEEE